MAALSLAEIRQRLADRNNDPYHVDLVQTELNGGVTTLDQIAALDDRPDADLLSISGLTQEGLENLVRRGAQRWQAISFWKCPRLFDLSPLADLPNVRHLFFYWNQRATRLWDLRRNGALRSLDLRDFRKLTDLTDLAAGEQLHELEVGNVLHAAIFSCVAAASASSALGTRPRSRRPHESSTPWSPGSPPTRRCCRNLRS